jgi:phosphate transport system permease protein
MQGNTRRMLDRAFSGLGLLSILLLTGALVVILTPLITRGMGAVVFSGTIEHRRFLYERFNRGDKAVFEREWAEAVAVRQPVYAMLEQFEQSLAATNAATRRQYATPLKELKKSLAAWLGPIPGQTARLMMRDQYGQTRWDRAQVKLRGVLYTESWDYSAADRVGRKVLAPRVEAFRGTALEPLFAYVEAHAEQMLKPRRTVYWGFFTDESFDSHFFGGIWPEMLGTFYLAVGAMLFAVPMGVTAAIYLTEYARETAVVGALRTCISTLAGVPSIVFGLFGLAFFINSVGVSPSKSVLAGSLTLALMILPTVIRASEEAILAVPRTYKEAALSLGAGRWHTVMTVILPAALPGILTGAVISLGRAAGETAPIIFTAAVSVGPALKVWETLTQATPALSWNIYNLATEHEAVDEIRHVQFGMVLTLVAMVLLLNLAAILVRARVVRRLRG